MGRNVPREPRSELRQGAAAIHEWYVALVDAGFTEAQAQGFVMQMLIAQMQMHSPPEV